MIGRRGFLGRAVATAAGVPFLASASAAVKTPTLRSLLERSRMRHPGPRGSNHTSMALLSLAALGATPERIRSLGEDKLARGQRFPSGGPSVTRENWREHLGNMDALPGLRAMFNQEVARKGIAGALRHHLPVLLPGVGAHAFHAIIRTGYGVRFDDPGEVAMGLAYWAITYLPLGALSRSGAQRDPGAALAAVRKLPLLTVDGRQLAGLKKPDGLNIAGSMQWVSTLNGFGPAASSLMIDDSSLAAIARAMVRLHRATDDFTALHAITGTHAYRTLEPFVADRAAGRRYLWQALVAAYVSMGAPLVGDDEVKAKLPSWTEVVAKAVASGDDHDLKLTDIAREEFGFYRDPVYLQSAAIQLDLA